MAQAMNQQSSIQRDRTEHPGTDGLWIFVFIDMIIFLLMFLTYVSEKIRIPEIFSQSQAHLNVWFGLGNTLILLTSSWCMVQAVNAARRGGAAATANYLAGALAFGAAFGINKVIEYNEKIVAGISPATNPFYALYFAITGIHFLHVIGGMVFLLHCRNRARAEVGKQHYLKKIENVGLFWHFVDAVWIFIFPMIYLAGLK